MAKKRKMLTKVKFEYSKHGKGADIEVEVDLSRFERQYEDAQYVLDSRVMQSMERFMPKVTNTFINVTKAMSAAIAGSGTVVAAAPPMGRFLYEGKVMVDEVTGSPWARKGAKKVLVSEFSGETKAKKNITYDKNANPDATDHWFIPAKENDLDLWLKEVKKTAGGG